MAAPQSLQLPQEPSGNFLSLQAECSNLLLSCPYLKASMASHHLQEETLILSMAFKSLKGLVLSTGPAALAITLSPAPSSLAAQHSLPELPAESSCEDVGW